MGEAKPPPLEQLRALDRAIARRGASTEARESVRRKLRQSAVEQPFHARLRWWPAIAFAAGAVTMAVLLIPDDGAPTEPAVVAKGSHAEAKLDTPPPAATQAPVDRACTELQPGIVELEVAACVRGDGVRVTARLPSRLRWDAARIEVEAGELLFDVAPRPERPLHVTLGAVDIEVVGTRFIVHHEDAHRWIAMLEGHVRARVGDGAAQDLRDGQRLDWPSPPALAPARPTRPTATPKPTRPDDGLTSLLDRVAALRRDGAFREAVELLRSTDTRRWSPRARQLVSYEIGTLLERQLGDVEQACAHWAEHRRRFPNGRHDAIVARSLERLRCDEPR